MRGSQEEAAGEEEEFRRGAGTLVEMGVRGPL